jgi:hypothetical protein
LFDLVDRGCHSGGEGGLDLIGEGLRGVAALATGGPADRPDHNRMEPGAEPTPFRVVLVAWQLLDNGRPGVLKPILHLVARPPATARRGTAEQRGDRGLKTLPGPSRADGRGPSLPTGGEVNLDEGDPGRQKRPFAVETSGGGAIWVVRDDPGRLGGGVAHIVRAPITRLWSADRGQPRMSGYWADL